MVFIAFKCHWGVVAALNLLSVKFLSVVNVIKLKNIDFPHNRNINNRPFYKQLKVLEDGIFSHFCAGSTSRANFFNFLILVKSRFTSKKFYNARV